MARKRYHNPKGQGQIGEFMDAPLGLAPMAPVAPQVPGVPRQSQPSGEVDAAGNEGDETQPVAAGFRGRFRGRGRGAGLNPGNRFETVRLHVLGEYLDQEQQERQSEAVVNKGDTAATPTTGLGHVADERGQAVATQVFADRTRTIINKVQSALVGFDWTLNPYRGCEHGCIYCYARPYHEYLGLSCGIDFETKIMAKFDAAQLLRKELAHPRWRAEPIIMSGITDCWQPLDEKLQLARQCLQVLAQCRQPVSIITKNRRLERDLDYLGELQRHQAVDVQVTITTLDPHFAAISEPRASAPSQRLELVRSLSQAGIPVNVMIAPVIPALTDQEVPEILEAAAEAGATRATYILLRLPWQLKELYEDWLRRHFPDRAEHALSLLRQAYGGKLYDADAAWRGRGGGVFAAQWKQMFKLYCKKHHLNKSMPGLSNAAFIRPDVGGQGWLWPEA